MSRKREAVMIGIGILAGLALSGPAAAAADYLQAIPSRQTFYVNGQKVEFEAYSIHGNNFVKVRDIGKAVALELGGKSPCIVDKSARIPLAARRIVFGKYLNCGQTCVAPDYILCHEDIKEELIFAVKKEITRQFGRYPLGNPDYGKIINERHFHRILGLIDPQKLVWGGE